MDKIVKLLTSLRLTVVTLAMAMVLVFFGTLAQVEQGLYLAQANFFQSIFVWWGPDGADWKVPVWPGGYLLGWILLINLVAAHMQRFELSKKKAGIFLVHGGLILLLLGQFVTELFQVESAMRLAEGEMKNYSESFRKNELAIIHTSREDRDEVVAVPERFLQQGGELALPDDAVPFQVQVKEYWPNSMLTTNAQERVLIMKDGSTFFGEVVEERAGEVILLNSMNGERLRLDKEQVKERREGMRPPATKGFGPRVFLFPLPLTYAMDSRNIPSAVVELVGKEGSLGTWLVSAQTSLAQQVDYEGSNYALALRFKRHYKPYYIQLLDFTHDRYQGTDLPKNFSSRIRLIDPGAGSDQERLIYMNNPLRYGGETYYQGGFEPGDTVSILQVVRNPAWLTPYLAVSIVGAGLLVQFLSHLYGFVKKRSA